MLRATWNGAVLAESDDIVMVEGNAYFPRESLNEQYFEDSSHHSLCPWKGLASYMTVTAFGERNENAAWHYPHPSPLARKIKDRVAFWHGVQIQEHDEEAARDAAAAGGQAARRG